MEETPLKLQLTISSDPVLGVKAESDPSMSVIEDSVRVGEGADLDEFEGPYDVVPAWDAIELPTKDTIMTDDVTVEPIPYIKASNVAGGYTVTIG